MKIRKENNKELSLLLTILTYIHLKNLEKYREGQLYGLQKHFVHLLCWVLKL